MSYKNNWLKSLSESYNTNHRGQVNLSEELASQVALNEQLVDLVKALCEELGVDPQDLLEDDGTIKEDFRGAVRRAGTKVREVASAIGNKVADVASRIAEPFNERGREKGRMRHDVARRLTLYPGKEWFSGRAVRGYRGFQEASDASVNNISNKMIQAANDPRVSEAEKMATRRRWLDAQNKRAEKFNSPTIGGRVVKK